MDANLNASFGLLGLNWDDLKVFYVTAEGGSVRAGSEVLNVNASTVSRRIATLEKVLDTRLFEKLPSGYVLTPDGKNLFDHVRQIKDRVGEINNLKLEKSSGLKGRVRVTVCSKMIAGTIMQDIADFAQLNPSILIDLVPSKETLNLSNREADIALRITSNPPEHLVGKKISDYSQVEYVSRQLYSSSDSLSSIPKLGIQSDVLSAHNLALDNTTPMHRVSDPGFLYDAVKSGLGSAILPCFIADKDPDLMRIPNGRERLDKELWILMHPDMRDIARVKALYLYLVHKLSGYVDAFSGRQYFERAC